MDGGIRFYICVVFAVIALWLFFNEVIKHYYGDAFENKLRYCFSTFFSVLSVALVFMISTWGRALLG